MKVGDDLRQDQLVLQMISLMNKLLLEEKLDLCLTPYAVLATSIDAGLMEFIPSAGLGDILRGGSTIGKVSSLSYHFIKNVLFQYLEGCKGPNVKENYVRSCAGYCVITYILGIGDRHNDNLLITEEGKLESFRYVFLYFSRMSLDSSEIAEFLTIENDRKSKLLFIENIVSY